MSTANKLTYLNTTKSKIKDAINLAGASITNEPFRQYSSKLYDRYLDILKNGTGSLYSAMPKVTGTGTELSLQNTAELPMTLELSASESTQNTTTGKNLFDDTNIGHGYLDNSGAYYSQADTWTTGLNYIEVNPNTTYILSAQTTATRLIYSEYDSSKAFISPRKEVAVGNSLTTGENTSYIRLSINDPDASSIMLEPGSTATDYEPYTGGIASPNPNYPQNINVVTGSNSVKVSTGDKNLANLPIGTSFLQGLTPTITNGSIIHAEGTATGGFSNITNDQIVDTNDILTLSIADYPTTSDIQVVYKESSDGEIKNKVLASNDKSITFENGLYQYRLAIVHISSNTTYNFTFKVQLEKGTTATTYAVHKEQNLSLSLGSLEFAGIGDYKDKIFNNIPSNPLYDANLVEGGWYKYKRIYKYIITGNENWGQRTANLFNALYLFDETPFLVGYGLSNFYIFNSVQSGIDASTKHGEFALQLDNNEMAYSLFIKNSNYSTLNAFKTYLQQLYADNKPVVIYFPLVTPTTEQITDTTLISQLEALKNAVSYDDETNISQTNANRPFVISASAIKNSME